MQTCQSAIARVEILQAVRDMPIGQGSVTIGHHSKAFAGYIRDNIDRWKVMLKFIRIAAD